jgi:acyl-CoA hydrolase
MNLHFESNFTVMPDQCNYMFPMIFGGAFFSQIDLCAACCVTRLLHDSLLADSSVTYKVLDLTFHRAAECGDIIFMEADVVELRHKSVTVAIKAYREKRAKPGREFIADATFVFVTKKGDEFVNHGLSMPQAA